MSRATSDGSAPTGGRTNQFGDGEMYTRGSSRSEYLVVNTPRQNSVVHTRDAEKKKKKKTTKNVAMGVAPGERGWRK